MGNNQSTECPSSFCKVLCFGRPPSNSDDGEWFGNLPKDKKRRRSRKSGKTTSRLPSVPEEASTCSGTVETDEGSSSVPLSSSSLSSRTEAVDEGDEVGSARPNLGRRAASAQMLTGQILKPTRRVTELPKTQLTFVNGQFVDLSTEEGRKFAEMFAAKKEDDDGSSPDVSVRGVETHVSGHCGIIRESSDKSRSPTRRSLAALPGMLKKRSAFASSILTASSSLSSQDGDESKGNSREAVSSIVMLGGGFFLTAAVADRNIKMWRVTKSESDGSSPSITFVRDFSGCPTGITCLTKVDRKGRFLSGSKSGTVMLWDSRFNCNDPQEDEGESQLGRQTQVLLATFENLMRRRVDTIAMIEDGSYVRPTDNVDWNMMAAMTKKAVKEGSDSVQRAAKERQIIACSLQFASITGAHRTVKIWSVKHNDRMEDEEESPVGKNVAEIKLLQELEHDNVVESVATIQGKSMLLAGDRMGGVTLWKRVKNVFKRGSPKIWQCIRVFNWRHTSELHTCTESMKFGITSLSFLGEKFFVSGAKGGDIRIWNVNGSGAKDEVVHKELIGLSGAHSSEITSIVTGKNVVEGSSKEKMMTFNTCGKDGMVLSFMVPAERPIPRCFNAVNVGIAYRYVSDGDSICGFSLGCHEKEQYNTTLIVGSSCGGIKVLQQPCPSLGPQDALLAYRQQIKEESLTLQVIAENAFRAIKCTDHKKHMQTYGDCFTGSDLVSFLVNEKHAASRDDAVILGCALQKHMSLFRHVSKECQLLEDDIRSFYRFDEEFKRGKRAKQILRKSNTM